MKVSVCMASFDRDPDVLRRTLESVCSQKPPFEFEVIVVDDGSEHGAPDVCGDFPVRYHRIERPPVARSASVAHNVAYRLATGDIIIAQSDDVVHQQNDSIEVMCRLREENQTSCFILATVLGCNEEGVPASVYSGVWNGKLASSGRIRNRRLLPYFFLGAVYRKDVYAIGGDDEDFVTSGGQAFEDAWFGNCLMYGSGLTPVYTDKVLAYHIWHPSRTSRSKIRINSEVYDKKRIEAEVTGVWCSSGGPWEMTNA